MAENSTKIILTAEDRTAPALASVTRGLGGMQAEAMRAAGALSAIGFTAAAASAVAYVRSVINAADEMQKLSQRTGIAAKDLAGWKLAADLSGASLESVAKGIKGLSTYAAEYGETLRKVGVDTSDPQKALMQLADLFAALPDGMEKSALATKLFGKAGQDLIPMLNQGSRALEEQRRKADEYGKRMAEIGPDAEKFNDNLEEAGFYAQAAGQHIAAYFLPGLAGMSKWLVDIANGGEKAQQALEWIMGERFTRMMVLAEHPLLVGPNKRSSSGKIGGDKGGLTPEEEEALGERNVAGMKAAELVRATSGGAAGTKGKTTKAAKIVPMLPGENSPWEAMPLNALREGQKAAAAEEKRLATLRAKYVDLADPLQKYRDQLDEIQKLQELKLLTADQALEAGFKVQDAMTDAFRGTASEIEKQNDAARELGLTFSSAFEDAIIGGKGLQQVLQGLVQDVSRIFLRKAITEPLGNAMTDMFKGFDLGSFFGGARAAGGPVDAGRTYLVGEQGPELFIPGSNGAIAPNAALGGSAPAVTVIINESPNGGGQVRSRNEGGRSIVEIVVAKVKGELMQDVRGGGDFAQTIQGAYGLNRAAGAY